MATEFRQRSIGEFLKILKRRKWYILLPTIALGVAVAYVVSQLPYMYESKTSLTLKPPTISNVVVQPLTENDLSTRLQTMNQEILSRTNLESMILKYNLFQFERATGMDMAQIVDKMRNNVKVEVEKGEAEKVTGFVLRYSDRSPESARLVASELASKYVNAQVQTTIKGAEDTKEFIETQLAAAKADLDNIQAQRLQIMTQNSQNLPEAGQGVIAQLEGLRQKEQSISKEKEMLFIEKARLNDSIRAYNSQINLAESFGSRDAEDAAKQTRIEDSPTYGQLISQKAALSAKLENLLKEYRPKHPDVIATQTALEKIENELENLKSLGQQRAQSVAQRSNRITEAQKENIKIDIQKAQGQIASIDQQLRMKDEQIGQNSQQIMLLESRLNSIPNVKVALETIENEYQTKKATYDDLLKKSNSAQLQVSRETNSQGETIRVVDQASLPTSPANASKRYMLMFAGFALGLAIGLAATVILESRRFFTIQNIEDAKYYTGLPVLASVPALLTEGEISRRNRLHWLRVMAGIAIAVVSIPLIIFALQASRIFERIAS